MAGRMLLESDASAVAAATVAAAANTSLQWFNCSGSSEGVEVSLTRTSSACSLLIARSFGFLVLLLEFYIASALVRTSELRLYMRPRQGLYTVYHRGTWTCKPYYVKWSVVSKGYMQ